MSLAKFRNVRRGLREMIGLSNPKVFISYRRSDAGGYAGQLRDALTSHYGHAIYLDHDKLRGGAKFAEELVRAVVGADVVLALIGPKWESETKDGKRRLEDPEDWVRREIELALTTPGVTVIPVLVGGAAKPNKDDLPESMQPLFESQVATVRPDRFKSDLSHLKRSIGGWFLRWYGLPFWVWLGLLIVAGALLATVAIRLRPESLNTPPRIDVPSEPIEVVSDEDVEIDLLSWASDEEGDELSLSSFDLTSAQDGSVSSPSDGMVVYRAARDYYGWDSFDFTVTDSGGLSMEGTAFFEVILGSMAGTFNVVVAEFSQSGGTDERLGESLANMIQPRFEAELEAILESDIQIADPTAIGSIEGETAADRVAAAAELAERVNANVVFYGTLEIGEGRSSLTPQLYLSGKGLTGAAELTGSYDLGTLVIAGDELALAAAARAFLEPLVTSIGALFAGLADYQADDFPGAEERFLAALQNWPASNAVEAKGSGKEVVYQLLGNVAGEQGDLAAARDYYESALAIAPGYPRSLFGVAEVQFQESRGENCGVPGRPTVTSGLEDALDQFRAVAELQPPELSFLDTRALVQIGRISLCLFINGVDRLEEARAALESAVTNIDSNQRLFELRSEAHGNLALYHVLRGDWPSAVPEYESAIEFTLDQDSVASHHRSLGWLYECKLEEPKMADGAYANSVDLTGAPEERIACGDM